MRFADHAPKNAPFDLIERGLHEQDTKISVDTVRQRQEQVVNRFPSVALFVQEPKAMSESAVVCGTAFRVVAFSRRTSRTE